METVLTYIAATLLTAFAGGLVFYNLLPMVTSVEFAEHIARLKRRWKIITRYPELGGYVHDTATYKFFPPSQAHYVTGTWTDAAGAVAGTIAKSKAAADNTAVVTIPITPLQNSGALKGSYIKSIDVYWEVLTAAMDAVTAVINLARLPADTAAFAAVTAQTFTYDAGHDTAAERITLDQHKMTLTLTTPIWLDDDDLLLVQITFDAALTSALTFFGARASLTVRL